MSSYRFVIWSLAGMVFAGCGRNTPQQRNEILALREMSELVTVEYVVTKIIRANDNKTWFKLGDRKILMSCRASLKAGIDLAQLTADNIKIADKKITLQIPSAKLVSLNIPPENIVVEYEEIDLFRLPFKSEERDDLAAQAETQIRNSAEAMGLLQTADENALSFLTDFLQRLGYTDITITSGNQPVPAKPLN